MGALYLYAITDHPERPIGVGVGIANAELHRIAYREIAMVVSTMPEDKLPPTAANVMLHERVIESLMAERTLLPARFGMLLKNQQAALDALAKHYDAYLANLDRVRGRVELGLRVLWRASEPIAAVRTSEPYRDGRSYLLARLAEERHAQAERRAAEAQAAILTKRLAELAADSVVEVLVTPRMLLKAAYLVDQTQIGAFQQAVGEQQARDDSLRFLCTGPWPAYHFVTATE
jgi:hypothetical protein